MNKKLHNKEDKFGRKNFKNYNVIKSKVLYIAQKKKSVKKFLFIFKSDDCGTFSHIFTAKELLSHVLPFTPEIYLEAIEIFP